MSLAESVDDYLALEYIKRDYTCLHFTRDAWLELTGVDIFDRLSALLASLEAGKRGGVRRSHARSFKRLDAPQSPCLVLMQRARHEPHVGLFLRGKVLHLKPSGAEFMPLDIASYGFKTVKFYK